jgi:thiopurine S-methyltransferase
MDANFWHKKWERGEIGFHESQANPALVAHIERLKLAANSRLFLPLCGKTLDIGWLLERGYRVAGVELSALAVDALFDSLGVTPTLTPQANMTRYSAENIDIWVGNLFDLSPDMLGNVDAIYDRAALVALPKNMRKQYASQLIKLSNTATQLLITFEYEQQHYAGPPFAVDEGELRQLYDSSYSLTLLAQTAIAGGFKGTLDATNATWLLQRRVP